MRIVLPGGSGQVGQMLARHFHARGHRVTVLSRSAHPSPWKTLSWDGRTTGDWVTALEGSDLCINLTGRFVNCRYNQANRREIVASRVDATRVLGQVIAGLDRPPALWMNASTATIYRHTLDTQQPNDEFTGVLGGGEPGAPDTWNFSISVAKAWEQAFDEIPTPRTRKVALRSALTLSPDQGGVFDVLLGLVRHGLGGTQGSGKQWVSWIHEVDFIAAVEWIVGHPELEGPVNLAAPSPIHNRDFMRVLRETCGVRIGLPAPAFLIEIGTRFMQTESELVLKSRRVVPGKLMQSGFEFRFEDWPGAAKELVKRWRALQR
ncbi:hypothetical protein SAMN05421771_3484 [Granulicella pectinivorans]|uniref:DUF1731 domain-containing protein n=1 Tax=Granulicella pectinivorans TaxID=474950 RepID=A0A1I6MS10_9BACT|nr:TIGR01777 family oxidoreductase [Granulicella pectinivorans]SFS18505.1 hypothetical protein SAMN05421771_3484 [Granulicella pectinivorans]